LDVREPLRSEAETVGVVPIDGNHLIGLLRPRHPAFARKKSGTNTAYPSMHHTPPRNLLEFNVNFKVKIPMLGFAFGRMRICQAVIVRQASLGHVRMLCFATTSEILCRKKSILDGRQIHPKREERERKKELEVSEVTVLLILAVQSLHHCGLGNQPVVFEAVGSLARGMESAKE
jgi:hypothetical protein